MIHVLFVDDNAHLLAGLRRMLRGQRKHWKMDFANCGTEALQKFEQTPFDVVVTDMRMPGMDGAQLLSKIRASHPDTVRIMLSGQSEKEAILRSVGPAHQFLSKPCDAELLKRTIERACQLRARLSDSKLTGLVAQIDHFPMLPAIYERLVNDIHSPDASVDKIGQLIASDIGATTKVLQLVNSSFFGLAQRVTDPVHAVSLLGLELMKSIVLSAGVFSQCDTMKCETFSLQELIDHSLSVARYASELARSQPTDTQTVDDAFLSGMLHDMGKAILASSFPEDYQDVACAVAGGDRALFEVEREAFGADHAAVGAYLLNLWGLPDSVVEAVAYHHSPNQWARQDNRLGALVYASDMYARLSNQKTGADQTELPSTSDPHWDSQLSAWFKILDNVQPVSLEQ